MKLFHLYLRLIFKIKYEKMKKVLCALVCIFIVNFIQAQVTVVINEIMAQNSITIQDNTGDYDDYIELYNYVTSTVDIG